MLFVLCVYSLNNSPRDKEYTAQVVGNYIYLHILQGVQIHHGKKWLSLQHAK